MAENALTNSKATGHSRIDTNKMNLHPGQYQSWTYRTHQYIIM